MADAEMHMRAGVTEAVPEPEGDRAEAGSTSSWAADAARPDEIAAAIVADMSVEPSDLEHPAAVEQLAALMAEETTVDVTVRRSEPGVMTDRHPIRRGPAPDKARTGSP